MADASERLLFEINVQTDEGRANLERLAQQFASTKAHLDLLQQSIGQYGSVLRAAEQAGVSSLQQAQRLAQAYVDLRTQLLASGKATEEQLAVLNKYREQVGRLMEAFRAGVVQGVSPAGQLAEDLKRLQGEFERSGGGLAALTSGLFQTTRAVRGLALPILYELSPAVGAASVQLVNAVQLSRRFSEALGASGLAVGAVVTALALGVSALAQYLRSLDEAAERQAKVNQAIREFNTEHFRSELRAAAAELEQFELRGRSALGAILNTFQGAFERLAGAPTRQERLLEAAQIGYQQYLSILRPAREREIELGALEVQRQAMQQQFGLAFEPETVARFGGALRGLAEREARLREQELAQESMQRMAQEVLSSRQSLLRMQEQLTEQLQRAERDRPMEPPPGPLEMLPRRGAGAAAAAATRLAAEERIQTLRLELERVTLRLDELAQKERDITAENRARTELIREQSRLRQEQIRLSELDIAFARDYTRVLAEQRQEVDNLRRVRAAGIELGLARGALTETGAAEERIGLLRVELEGRQRDLALTARTLGTLDPRQEQRRRDLLQTLRALSAEIAALAATIETAETRLTTQRLARHFQGVAEAVAEETAALRANLEVKEQQLALAGMLGAPTPEVLRRRAEMLLGGERAALTLEQERLLAERGMLMSLRAARAEVGGSLTEDEERRLREVESALGAIDQRLQGIILRARQLEEQSVGTELQQASQRAALALERVVQIRQADLQILERQVDLEERIGRLDPTQALAARLELRQRSLQDYADRIRAIGEEIAQLEAERQRRAGIVVDGLPGRLSEEQEQQLERLRTQQEVLTRQYRAAQVALQIGLRDLAERTDFRTAMEAGLTGAIRDLSDWSRQVQDIIRDTARGMSSAMTDGFFAVLEGRFRDLGSISHRFARSLLESVVNAFSQQIVAGFLGQLRLSLGLGAGGFINVGSATAAAAGAVAAAGGVAAGRVLIPGAGQAVVSGGQLITSAGELALMGTPAPGAYGAGGVPMVPVSWLTRMTGGLLSPSSGLGQFAQGFFGPSVGLWDASTAFGAAGLSGVAALQAGQAVVSGGQFITSAGELALMGTAAPGVFGAGGTALGAGAFAASALGVVGGLAGLGFTAFNAWNQPATPMNIAMNAISGAVSGAMIGSIFPGVGTVIGAVVGAAIGGGLTGKGGKGKKSHAQREAEEAGRANAAARQMYDEVAATSTGEELFQVLTKWNTGYVGGTSSVAVVSYITVDGVQKFIGTVPGVYELATLDELMRHGPETYVASVQAGVNQSLLEQSNRAITELVKRKIQEIRALEDQVRLGYLRTLRPFAAPSGARRVTQATVLTYGRRQEAAGEDIFVIKNTIPDSLSDEDVVKLMGRMVQLDRDHDIGIFRLESDFGAVVSFGSFVSATATEPVPGGGTTPVGTVTQVGEQTMLQTPVFTDAGLVQAE